MTTIRSTATGCPAPDGDLCPSAARDSSNRSLPPIGRVARACTRAPTDPDVRNYRIRLLEITGSLGDDTWSGRLAAWAVDADS